MTHILQIWRSKSGNASLLALVIALGIAIISSGVYEYMRLMLIAQGVRDAVQSAVISVATDNYDEVYNGLREGYSGGYALEGSSWAECVETGDVYERLDGLLGLARQSGRHVKLSATGYEYALSGLNVDVENAPLAPSSTAARKFLATATIALEVPLSFGWESLPPMRITLRVKSGYVPKF